MTLTPLVPIVVAAAGPDKKSFGCSHEAEWTHFGKAFFDEALRAAPRVTGENVTLVIFIH